MNARKRVLDVLGAAVGLVLLGPLMVAIAAAIKLHDGGPAFFRQIRVGRDGRPFRMWKFRTMVPEADRLGGSLTVGEDARVTGIGRFLRRAKLDELPQLLNVLRGEMSLVGPRPEVPRYVARYTASQRRVLELTPGITDPASLRFRHESELLARARDPEGTYVEAVLPEKLRLNLEYADRATLRTDIAVILRTLGQMRPSRPPREIRTG